jgi:hypothetical protein
MQPPSDITSNDNTIKKLEETIKNLETELGYSQIQIMYSQSELATTQQKLLEATTYKTMVPIIKTRECSVCLESKKLFPIYCGGKHKLCNTCFRLILNSSNRCPLCRRDLLQ